MTRKSYLIASANGYGNVGDDMCGYGAEYLANQVPGRAQTTVTAPPFDAALVDKANVVVVGGGGVIYDSDMANVENYMSYIEHGKRRGSVTAVLGVGVQGLTTPEGKERYRQVLSSTDVVTVRSPVDKRELDDIGVQNVVATQDLGFLADKWVSRPSRRDKRTAKRLVKSRDRPSLGLSIIDLVKIQGRNFTSNSQNFMDCLHQNLERICQDFNVCLLVHSRDDLDFYNQLASSYDLTIVPYNTISDFSTFWAAYQELDLVVGSRFHSVILACLTRKPVVSVSSATTKQNRLANYDMPTLLRQRLLFSDTELVRDLFTNLKRNFEGGMYKPISDWELQKAQQRATQNGSLLRAAVEGTVA